MPSQEQTSSFPSTEWTELIQPIQEGSPQATDALNRLCAVYRPSILLFFRRRGIDGHEAEDMAQNFIASLLRNEVWTQIDRAKGLFRCFLATRLRWFVLNHWRAERPATMELEDLGEPPADPGGSPEDSFDRAWAWDLIRQVISNLERDWESKRSGIPFRDMAGFLTSEADESTIADLAARSGKSPNTLYQTIHRLKQDYRAELTACVRATVSSEAEIKSEIRYLMQCLK